MVAKKAVASINVEGLESPAVQGAAPGSGVQPAQADSGPVYRDREYTKRTLILPSGRSVAVDKGRVTAGDDELLAFLKQHADFEPVQE